MKAVLALAILALAIGCAAPPPEPARHVLLISIDTLRADHLGLYGYPRPTSPHLDALALESVVFENAWSTAPWTLPAHASLLTGLYPSHHGARRKLEPLAAGVVTLAQRLREAGFATGAVVNVSFLARRFGLARGFDHHQRVPETETPEGAAARVTEKGMRWLEDQGQQRTFLFLHYFDVHSDYASRPRFTRRFVPEGSRLRGTTAEIYEIQSGRRSASPADIRGLVGHYDAGIAQLDDHLGALFARLRSSGRWDDTLLIVTADHGESFREHGDLSHGFNHYEEQLHVPLLLRGPGVGVGLRIATPVSLVDVAPTVLGALGLRSAPGLDGADLAPLWRDPVAPRPGGAILAETGPAMRDVLRSAREGSFKLILDRERDQQELFDLRADPTERNDVAREHPEVAQRLRAAIQALDRSALPAGETLALPPEVSERLRALGYGDVEAP